MNPPKSMKKTLLNPMVLLPFFTDSDVPNDDSITGLNIGSSKKKKPSRAMLRPRRRLNVWCAVDCAGGGLWAIATPVSSVPLLKGRKYRLLGKRCQELADENALGGYSSRDDGCRAFWDFFKKRGFAARGGGGPGGENRGGYPTW